MAFAPSLPLLWGAVQSRSWLRQQPRWSAASNADDLVSDLFDDRLSTASRTPLPRYTALVAIAALNSLELTGGCARGNGCACESTVFEDEPQPQRLGYRASRGSRAQPTPSITATSFSNRCCCVEAVSTTVIRTAICGHPRRGGRCGFWGYQPRLCARTSDISPCQRRCERILTTLSGRRHPGARPRDRPWLRTRRHRRGAWSAPGLHPGRAERNAD